MRDLVNGELRTANASDEASVRYPRTATGRVQQLNFAAPYERLTIAKTIRRYVAKQLDGLSFCRFVAHRST